jgi:hypothetical protein|tara:strand:- start:38334 stop:38957 length:624 start_codon:yes stop_codon:yes gene_type:complete
MNKEPLNDQAEFKGEEPWPLIIMLGMVFSVIAAGFFLVPKTEEDKLRWLSILGTNNYGELMNPPVALTGKLLDTQGNTWSADEEVPWKLVLVNQGICEQTCQELADVVARVHMRMNRLSPDIKRGYLQVGIQSVFGQESLEAIGYDFLHTENLDMEALLDGAGVPSLSAGPLVFVMNPLEVFFLYYTAEHEGIGMLEDIEHVVKLAQ